ncbi:MAG: sulfate ABC transporter ATP-binding protein [Proteobacteria bacterium]|nr:sulfate ABC transporter ATP-binding protein [Pseudomonadota bacterium]
MGIVVEHLSKRFGDFVAVDDVSLRVERGQLAAMLGPSGGGKSTILRMIAGLEKADSGTVELGGARVDHMHTRDRQVGFVFQHYALFRHMTVEKNVGFGLSVRKVPEDEKRARVNEMLKLMNLTGFEKRYPDQLSGGQRQRVALARALAPRPRLLLLDEPFGAVDAKVREELGRWLRNLHDELDVTSIFVTHDQEEAFSLADKVMVIAKGRLEQSGQPVDILDQPATEFMARFVGDANVFDSVVQDGVALVGRVAVPVRDFENGSAVRLVIRSYDLKFFKQEDGPAIVHRMLYLGDRVKVDASIEGAGPIFAQFPRRSSLLRGIEPGCRIGIEVTLARAFAKP